MNYKTITAGLILLLTSCSSFFQYTPSIYQLPEDRSERKIVKKYLEAVIDYRLTRNPKTKTKEQIILDVYGDADINPTDLIISLREAEELVKEIPRPPD